jgi:hypothetical protein
MPATRELQVTEETGDWSFADVAHVRDVLRLDDTAVPLGAIKKAIQTKSGDLFVSDRSTQAVYRFDRVGRYVRSYDFRDLPNGDRYKLADFDATDASILMLSDRLLVDRSVATGAITASVKPAATGVRLARSTGLVCVWSLMPAVECYDGSLTRVRPIVYNDPKLARHRYIPLSPIAIWNEGVIVLADTYSPRLRLFERHAQTSTILSFPQSIWDAEAFEQLWAAKDLADNEENIENRVRRIAKVYRLPDDRLLAYEHSFEPRVGQIILLERGGVNAKRVPSAVGALPTENATLSIFDLIVGTSPTGVVGVIRNMDVARGLSRYADKVSSVCDMGQPCVFFLDFTTL